MTQEQIELEASQIDEILAYLNRAGTGNYSYLAHMTNTPIGRNVFAKIVREGFAITDGGTALVAANYTIEKLGIKVIEAGGYIKYIEQERVAKLVADQEDTELKRLQKENLILSKDKLEYEKTIRDVNKELSDLTKEKVILENGKLTHEASIRYLQTQLLKTTLLKNYWWVIATVGALCISTGIYVAKCLNLCN
jgi:hypothetical protein